VSSFLSFGSALHTAKFNVSIAWTLNLFDHGKSLISITKCNHLAHLHERRVQRRWNRIGFYVGRRRFWPTVIESLKVDTDEMPQSVATNNLASRPRFICFICFAADHLVLFQFPPCSRHTLSPFNECAVNPDINVFTVGTNRPALLWHALQLVDALKCFFVSSLSIDRQLVEFDCGNCSKKTPPKRICCVFTVLVKALCKRPQFFSPSKSGRKHEGVWCFFW